MATEHDPEYLKVYEAFPRRNGQKRGKEPGHKKWVKLNAAEKLMAKTDVEKRNRQNGWGKYIVDISRYMNEKMWTEDWQPYESADGSKSSTKNTENAFQPAGEVLAEMSWAEITLGRLFAMYVVGTVEALPVSDNPKEDGPTIAVAIKNELLGRDVPALQEEIDAKELTILDASKQLGMAFLKRLDKQFGRNHAERIFAHAGRSQAPWKKTR